MLQIKKEYSFKKFKYGKYSLIFPIRLSYLHGKIFSFLSKTVVIPDSNFENFLWKNSHLGNLCVATNGSYSICLLNKPRTILTNIIPSIFPYFSSRISDFIVPNQSAPMYKKIIKYFLRLLILPIKKILVPYEIKNGKTSFEILCAKKN